jgi:glycosyltransferase involved in cell wall biosynthesis
MRYNPKISVITVSYNHAEFIRQTIESVRNQNYGNVEHIIVDGGSTDGTIEILKEYDHLIWTSEPDKGQSDALNKGFSRATGDIIGWLNSDDWYAPNIFQDVVNGMRDYPVLLGAACITDREGQVKEVVENAPRGFFDLLRYWVPYAWLGQPSVFFSRELLESVKRPDGSYVDQDLFFTMDYDLWMRMSRLYPFTNRIDKILSYYRIYETNKTGSRPLATQRECARVFRRYANSSSDHEQTLSFILPVQEVDDNLRKTVQSILDQVMLNYELLVVDYSRDRATQKAIHSYVLDLIEAEAHISIRYTRSDSPYQLQALNSGIERACAPLLSFLQPGDVLPHHFSIGTVNIFSREPVGVLFPDIGRPEINRQLSLSRGFLYPDGLLSTPYFFPNFIVRRVVCLELGNFHSWENPALAVREFLLRAYFKAWAFVSDEGVSIEVAKGDFTREDEYIRSNMHTISETIVRNLEKEFSIDPFSKVRSRVRPIEAFFAAREELARSLTAS